jgi:hypothetical protein
MKPSLGLDANGPPARIVETIGCLTVFEELAPAAALKLPPKQLASNATNVTTPTALRGGLEIRTFRFPSRIR